MLELFVRKSNLSSKQDDTNSTIANITISWFSLLKLMGLNKLENVIHTNKWLSYNDIYRLVLDNHCLTVTIVVSKMLSLELWKDKILDNILRM